MAMSKLEPFLLSTAPRLVQDRKEFCLLGSRWFLCILVLFLLQWNCWVPGTWGQRKELVAVLQLRKSKQDQSVNIFIFHLLRVM